MNLIDTHRTEEIVHDEFTNFYNIIKRQSAAIERSKVNIEAANEAIKKNVIILDKLKTL